jgi:hypothetical protein
VNNLSQGRHVPVDRNAAAVVTTLAQAGSTHIAFRGLDFTPD